MRTNAILLFFVACALLGCNGRTKLTGAPIGDFSIEDAKFVFYGSADGFGVDLDGDEVNDSVSDVVIVLSTTRSLCKDLANNSTIDDLNQLENSQMLVINASVTKLSDDGPALEGDVIFQNDELHSISMEYVAIVDSQVSIRAQDLDDVVVTVSRESFGRLAANLTGTLDFNFNGTQQTSELTGDFIAQQCDSLDALALVGGFDP